MNSRPRVLILDNSPRHLGNLWFRKWLGKRLGLQVSAYHILGGSRIKSLADYDALVVSGSPASATEQADWILHEVDLVREADMRGMPVLGVCFGSQLIARAFYGKKAVRPSRHPEFGWHPISKVAADRDPVFKGIPSRFVSFQYHMEEVVPQRGMQILACNENVEVQAYRAGERLVWGLQFHPEVTPRSGRDLLRKTKHVYAKYGLDYGSLISQAQPNPVTEQIFRNFISTWQE